MNKIKANIKKTTLKWIAALSLAGVCFFSAANMNTVQAAYANPGTVSIAKPGYGYINVSSGTLNVRESASTNARVLASLAKDSAVMIVGQNGSFYMVQYDGNGNYGYVAKNYVKFEQPEYYLTVKNISGSLNMRAYASTSANVVASIPPNRSLAYLYDVTGWYCGVYGNVTGTVSQSYVERNSF